MYFVPDDPLSPSLILVLLHPQIILINEMINNKDINTPTRNKILVCVCVCVCVYVCVCVCVWDLNLC